MTKEEILHLGTLCRIALSEKEVESFATEIDAIISYVGEIQSIINEGEGSIPTVGARHNVFRDDELTNEPGSYTERIIAGFPRAQGDYLEVPKIIAQNE